MAKSAIEELKGKSPQELKKMGEQLAANMGVPEATPAQPAAPAAPATNRNARPTIDRNAVIEVLQYTNPKRGVSRSRYAHYRNGMTVDEYVKLAGTKGMPDIRWDQEVHGPGPLIKLHPAGTKLPETGKRVSNG